MARGSFTKFGYIKALRGRDLAAGEFRVLVAVWSYADERGRDARDAKTDRRGSRWLVDAPYRLGLVTEVADVWDLDDAQLIVDARVSLPIAVDALDAIQHLHQPTSDHDQGSGVRHTATASGNADITGISLPSLRKALRRAGRPDLADQLTTHRPKAII